MSSFSKKRVNTCVKFAKAFSYSLPIKINENIIQYLSLFGKQVWPFKNTKMLRMDGNKFQFDGIGDTHVLTVTIKKDATQQDVDELEKMIDLYIASSSNHANNSGS